jgi:hypothetical protein
MGKDVTGGSREMNGQSSHQDGSDDWSGFCAPGTTFKQNRVTISNNVSLRVVSFFPENRHYSQSVIMVPGIISVMLTFKKIVIGLNEQFVVHYVETREKSSSIVPEGASYDIGTIGSDIIEVISSLQMEDSEYILFGASMCATAVIERYTDLRRMPLGLILLEPNAVFDYPKWSLGIIRISALLYPIIKPFAKWYLKHFRVNMKDDYEMIRISSRALDAADPYKLKNTILAIANYEIWDRFPEIKLPVLIVYASKDTFHRHDDVMRILSMITDCEQCDLETHDRIHSQEFVNCFTDFIKKLL